MMSSLQSLRQIISTFKSIPKFDRTMQHLKVISAGNGKVHCEMPVHDEHVNLQGGLHGGMSATLVDFVSTCALGTCENPRFGVSVDLNVSYTAAAAVGDTLTITSEVLKVGKTLGFAAVDIKNQDGKLIATGRHTKFLSQ